ncbi:MAG: monovalent cation/H+ antiporter subunit D family protein [Clostridia bacterium]|nr:monovalent cation/H+ antiporter subunit D family protein [Clostridia bacterium]
MAPEIVLDYRPLWAVLISLVAAVLILLTGEKNRNLRETWTILAAFGKVAIVFSMLPMVLGGQVLESAPLYVAKGIVLQLRADTAGMLFAALASFLWVITSFYSIGYMRGHHEKHQTGYFAAFAVCLSATMGIAFAANLLTFFVFYEILTIATYPLVIHKRNPEAIRSGRKYLAYTLISGQLCLIAIIWTYVVVGHGNFQAGGFLTLDHASRGMLQFMFFMMSIGAAVKAGVMPLHGWLPDAMVAPTPVSALLHAVAVVKAGAFGILRVVGYVFGPELLKQIGTAEVLAWFAAFTIIASSLIAMNQDNLKRRLAFSTVGQLSYVVLGVSLLSPLGLLGGMFHIIAHAFMKITLFFCAGAIYVTTHKENISEMHGIGKQMPITIGAFTIASLGIAGVPFIVGFISKWNIALGALQTGQWLYIVVLIASAMLASTYLLPLGYLGFFKKSDKFTHYGEARKDMLIPIVITATFSIVLGILPNFGAHFYDLAAMSAQSIIDGIQLIGGGW